MNDGIDPQYCSLEYVLVDEVALAAAGLGKGSLLAKIDTGLHIGWCRCFLETGCCWE